MPRIDLHADQRAAVDFCTAADGPPLRIIQGGAGTGKTTIVRVIIDALGDEAVDLCAPTGKAAARMREACRHDASTVHRLLGYNGEGFTAPTLGGRIVIVDEATMLDSSLLAAVLYRSPRRVILVGDYAQLPPVDAGQPYHDLCHLRPELRADLTYCFRSREACLSAASAIRAGKRPERQAATAGERWEVRETGSIEDTHANILDLVRAGEITFAGGADVLLAPRNGSRDGTDPCTVHALNLHISRMVIPRDEDAHIVPGDRVINTVNNPELDIWNGTTATVHDVDGRGGFWLETDQPVRGGDGGETTRVRVTKGQARDLDLAYALTVHKSQGSQYNRVFFVCHRRDAFSLNRSLIYTAVTRTRSECMVLGSMEALGAGIARVPAKQTVLQRMITEGGA